MASYPIALPRPQATSYSLKHKSNVIRTDMEAGSPKQRQISSQDLDTVNVVWWFTDSEMATFRNWFRTDLGHGANWFTNIELALGNGIESVTARFINGDWTSELRAGDLQWLVKASLEVRPT
jgi:hypothetical protein